MFARDFTLGGSAAGADPDTFALILRNVLGARVKLVTGYPGGNDINLAMERGEVEGRCGWSWTSIKSQKTDWLRAAGPPERSQGCAAHGVRCDHERPAIPGGGGQTRPRNQPDRRGGDR